MPGARIEVGIGLKDGLSKGLKKQLGNVRKFTNASKRLFRGLGRSIFNVKTLIGGIIAGAAVRGVSRLIKATTTLDDQLQKLSIRLGLSTELLSSLKFAGEQSGIAFNNLSTGLQRVIRRFEEIRDRGAGVALPALKTLGPEIEKAVRSGESMETLLPKLADAFKNLETPAQRVLVAMGLFDTEGVALVQLFEGGSVALRAFRKEAEFFGLVVSRADVDASAAFNDALGRMLKSLEGVRNEIVRQFLPGLTRLFDKMATFIATNRKSIAEFFQPMAKSLKEITNEAIRNGLESLKSLTELTGLAMKIAAIGALEFANGLNHIRLAAIKFAILAKESPFLAGLISPAGAVALNFSGLDKGALKVRSTEIAEQIAAINASVAGLLGLKTAAAGPLTLPEVVVRGDRIPKDDDEPAKRTSQALLGVKSALDQIASRSSVFAQMEESIIGVAVSLENNLTDGFLDAVTGAKKAKDAFKDMAKSMIQDLIQIGTRMLIVKAIGGIAGGLGGLFGGSASGVEGFDFSGFGSVSSAFPSGAGGGVFSGPRSGFPATLHGTEAVAQLGPGKTIPVDLRGSGAPTIVNNITIEAGANFDERSVNAVVENATVVAQAVVDQIRQRRPLRDAILG